MMYKKKVSGAWICLGLINRTVESDICKNILIFAKKIKKY